jgi:hypothetical protein
MGIILDFISNIPCFFEKYAGDILGAFIGFLFALQIENLIEKGNTKKSIQNVATELIDIRDGFKNNKDNKNIPPCFAYGISLPIWDTIKQNGNILGFKGEKYYGELIGVYAKLEQLIQLENSLFENSHLLKDDEVTKKIETIVELRNKIYKELTVQSNLVALLNKKPKIKALFKLKQSLGKRNPSKRREINAK